MPTPIPQQLDILTEYERWREANATGTPDVSIEAYGRHLRARRYDDLVEEIASIVAKCLVDQENLIPALETIQQLIWKETA